jgi:hypothetical protein
MTRPTPSIRRALLLVGLIAVIAAGLRLGHGPAAAPAHATAPPASGGASAGPFSVAAPSLQAPGPAPSGAADTVAAAPFPDHAPRAAGEWQGMPVDRSTQVLCDAADSCGLAMACLGETCGPCERDDQCAAGETCVLDHCLLASRAACHSRADCAADALCVLTGTSPDPRGNAEMSAICLTASGGEDRTDEIVARDSEPAPPMPVPAQDLLDLVEADVTAPR